VRGGQVALLNPLEAVLGPVWVYVGVGEMPSVWTIGGGSLLIASLLAHEAMGRWSDHRLSSSGPPRLRPAGSAGCEVRGQP
jgi:hypothetical protein